MMAGNKWTNYVKYLSRPFMESLDLKPETFGWVLAAQYMLFRLTNHIAPCCTVLEILRCAVGYTGVGCVVDVGKTLLLLCYTHICSYPSITWCVTCLLPTHRKPSTLCQNYSKA